MTDAELVSLNAKGFIPGPGETEQEFVARIEAVRRTFSEHGVLARAHWDWARAQTKELFDFEPDSMTVFYSNQNLMPWHGAACWIDEYRVPKLQFREGFRKGRYLFYSRAEILAHESIHAARSAFEESRFEEFFAYASASLKWRRIFGPIFKRSAEVWVFLFSLLVSPWFNWGFLCVTLCISYGFFRLANNHRQLSKAGCILMGRLKDAKKARAVLFRLTDVEIVGLANGEWIEGDETLRWRMIRAAYFQ